VKFEAQVLIKGTEQSLHEWRGCLISLKGSRVVLSWEDSPLEELELDRAVICGNDDVTIIIIGREGHPDVQLKMESEKKAFLWHQTLSKAVEDKKTRREAEQRRLAERKAERKRKADEKAAASDQQEPAVSPLHQNPSPSRRILEVVNQIEMNEIQSPQGSSRSLSSLLSVPTSPTVDVTQSILNKRNSTNEVQAQHQKDTTAATVFSPKHKAKTEHTEQLLSGGSGSQDRNQDGYETGSDQPTEHTTLLGSTTPGKPMGSSSSNSNRKPEPKKVRWDETAAEIHTEQNYITDSEQPYTLAGELAIADSDEGDNFQGSTSKCCCTLM